MKISWHQKGGRAASVAALAVIVAAAIRWPTFAALIGISLIVIGVHEIGHHLAARRLGVKVNELAIGFGPKLVSVTAKHSTFSLRAVPLGGYVKPDEEQMADANAAVRIGIAVAGPAANVALAAALFAAAAAAGIAHSTTTIADTLPNSPARAAGLNEGDVITAVNGRSVATWDEFTAAIDDTGGRAASVQTSDRETGRTATRQITPRRQDGRWVIGVVAKTKTEPVHLRDVPTEAARMTWHSGTGTVKAVAAIPKAIWDNATGGADRGDVTSMVAVADIYQRTDALSTKLQLIAAVSMTVAAFNMLPVMPLDGGQIAVAAVEAVAGKIARRRVRISDRVKLTLAALVVLTLMSTSVYAMVRDTIALAR